jgi:hypothetical protein
MEPIDKDDPIAAQKVQEYKAELEALLLKPMKCGRWNNGVGIFIGILHSWWVLPK